jgi:excisionase family DNA binding protein
VPIDTSYAAEQPALGDLDLLTMTEVAALLHCSKAHVCNVVAGRVHGCAPIPAVHLGRRTLIRRESLIAWIAQNESSGGKIQGSPERGRKSA